MTSLAVKIRQLGAALDKAGIPHAFGGALALAWCTGNPRATLDIDLNVFVEVNSAELVFAALPNDVERDASDIAAVGRDGQVRLWWDRTPLDLFFDTTDFHRGLAGRARRERFGGADVSFLSCGDLAVFKAFFNRTKDWADLEEMVTVRSFEVDVAAGVLAEYLGEDDHRIARLRSL